MDTEHAVKDVPYIVHEAAMARQERTIRRLWIALIICIIGLIGMFVYEIQFEDIVIEAEQEADGDSNNYAVGGDYYGIPAESNN